MNEWQQKVRDFHEKFNMHIEKTPTLPSPEEKWLRTSLVVEEAEELVNAILENDLEGVADALVDLIYVTCGTGVSFGIDLQPLFEEVHRANMEKEGGGKRPDGKVLKPKGWKGPKIGTILKQQEDTKDEMPKVQQ